MKISQFVFYFCIHKVPHNRIYEQSLFWDSTVAEHGSPLPFKLLNTSLREGVGRVQKETETTNHSEPQMKTYR